MFVRLRVSIVTVTTPVIAVAAPTIGFTSYGSIRTQLILNNLGSSFLLVSRL
jgi:hypothetical protein